LVRSAQTESEKDTVCATKQTNPVVGWFVGKKRGGLGEGGDRRGRGLSTSKSPGR